MPFKSRMTSLILNGGGTRTVSHRQITTSSMRFLARNSGREREETFDQFLIAPWAQFGFKRRSLEETDGQTRVL